MNSDARNANKRNAGKNNAGKDRFSFWLALSLILVGVVLFASYVIYLPVQDQVASPQYPDLGLVLYSLASAGAAFIAWGWIMLALTGSAPEGQSRVRILKGSALGFLLLGLMRLGTWLFPHTPFEALSAVAATEFVLFLLLALVLYRKANVDQSRALHQASAA